MGEIHQIFNYCVSRASFERKTKKRFKSKFYMKNIQQFVNGKRRKGEYYYFIEYHRIKKKNSRFFLNEEQILKLK